MGGPQHGPISPAEMGALLAPGTSPWDLGGGKAWSEQGKPLNPSRDLEVSKNTQDTWRRV